MNKIDKLKATLKAGDMVVVEYRDGKKIETFVKFTRGGKVAILRPWTWNEARYIYPEFVKKATKKDLNTYEDAIHFLLHKA